MLTLLVAAAVAALALNLTAFAIAPAVIRRRKRQALIRAAVTAMLEADGVAY